MSSKLETLIHTSTRKLTNWLRRWDADIARALIAGRYRVTPEGLVLFDDKLLKGTYFGAVRQRPSETAFGHNLIVDQGSMKALGTMFFTDTKIPDWYLTLFSGSTTPANSLTAANFAAQLSEITSTTEGFSNATRPKFTPTAPAANVISNATAKAAFNIVATTSITATGGALVSSDVRGGASGTLWSAGLFDFPRELFNGETFDLGYQTSLTD